MHMEEKYDGNPSDYSSDMILPIINSLKGEYCYTKQYLIFLVEQCIRDRRDAVKTGKLSYLIEQINREDGCWVSDRDHLLEISKEALKVSPHSCGGFMFFSCATRKKLDVQKNLNLFIEMLEAPPNNLPSLKL